MREMSKAQRIAILDFHNGVTSKRHTMIANARTIAALVRNGWAAYQVGTAARLRRHYPERSAFVTRAGLIAAGVDMNAIHAEAMAEYAAALPTNTLDPIVEQCGESPDRS